MNYLKIIILCTLSFSAKAQGIINDSSIISITEGTIFFVNSDFTNNGTVINNGSLYVSGSWQNNNTYDEGQGTFVLSSPVDQIVNHNAQSFTNLRIAGGGKKIFRADLTIEESLILDDGILESENNSTLIVGANAEISGGSTLSYVNGPMRRNGIGDLFYPVGSNQEYLPVVMQQVSGINPQITVSAFSEDGNFNNDGSYKTINIQHYWNTTFNTGYESAYIELPILANNNFSDIDKLVVVGSDNLGGSPINMGAFSTNGSITDGSISSEEIATYSFYTLAELIDEGLSGGDLNVYNVITPNGDGIHDFFKIENIAEYPNNTVIIYNKWGNKQWETNGYDNINRRFEGIADNGSELTTGNYHYIIDKGNGETAVKGFLYIQR